MQKYMYEVYIYIRKNLQKNGKQIIKIVTDEKGN